MTITPNNFETDAAHHQARAPALYVSARQLGAGTHEEITIPAGATSVILSATADTYFIFGATPAAVVPVDTDDGSANERLSQYQDKHLLTKGNAKISVISAGTPIVTASFYAT